MAMAKKLRLISGLRSLLGFAGDTLIMHIGLRRPTVHEPH